MITKLTCRYSFEVLDFNCNGFGFTFNIGVSYLGIFYKTSMILTQCYTGSKMLIDGRPRTNFYLGIFIRHQCALSLKEAHPITVHSN